MRAEVEFLHEGQAAHKQLAAVDVQQHASWKKDWNDKDFRKNQYIKNKENIYLSCTENAQNCSHL